MSLAILIVDDEETFRKNTENYLSAKGYEVSGAGTLEEAKAHLAKNDTELILLDVNFRMDMAPTCCMKPPI